MLLLRSTRKSCRASLSTMPMCCLSTATTTMRATALRTRSSPSPPDVSELACRALLAPQAFCPSRIFSSRGFVRGYLVGRWECMTPGSRYVLISPCRNEAGFMRQTFESVLRQTVRPVEWVVVDDGSTDTTPAILAEYAATHPWIRVITRPDRGSRSVGPGVIEAFYSGYNAI